MKITASFTKQEVKEYEKLVSMINTECGGAAGDVDISKYLGTQMCAKSSAYEAFVRGEKDEVYSVEFELKPSFSIKLLSLTEKFGLDIISAAKSCWTSLKSIVSLFGGSLKGLCDSFVTELEELDPGDEVLLNEKGEESCWFEDKFMPVRAMNQIIALRNLEIKMSGLFQGAANLFRGDPNATPDTVIKSLEEYGYGHINSSIIPDADKHEHTLQESIIEMDYLLTRFPNITDIELFNLLKSQGYADPCDWEF